MAFQCEDDDGIGFHRVIGVKERIGNWLVLTIGMQAGMGCGFVYNFLSFLDLERFRGKSKRRGKFSSD